MCNAAGLVPKQQSALPDRARRHHRLGVRLLIKRVDAGYAVEADVLHIPDQIGAI